MHPRVQAVFPVRVACRCIAGWSRASSGRIHLPPASRQHAAWNVWTAARVPAWKAKSTRAPGRYLLASPRVVVPPGGGAREPLRRTDGRLIPPARAEELVVGDVASARGDRVL